jgi:hypothetical protein
MGLEAANYLKLGSARWAIIVPYYATLDLAGLCLFCKQFVVL